MPRGYLDDPACGTSVFGDDFAAQLGVLVAAASAASAWRELGPPLSEGAGVVAVKGEDHFREWLCEAVAVPAAERGARARTATLLFSGRCAGSDS